MTATPSYVQADPAAPRVEPGGEPDREERYRWAMGILNGAGWPEATTPIAAHVTALESRLATAEQAGRALAEFAQTAPGRLPQRVQDAIAALSPSPGAVDG